MPTDVKFPNRFRAAVLAAAFMGLGTAAARGTVTYTVLYTLSAPAGFSSFAPAGIETAAGGQVVGYGYATSTGNQHALLWSGSTGSAVDLNPNGFVQSNAGSTNGVQQVGWGYGQATGGDLHAMLWDGTAASAVDLNPTGFTDSYAYATDGSQQVGYGSGPATDQIASALLWNGSADSYIDLQSVLPPTFAASDAWSISGDTVYGTANDASGNFYAIAWTISVPEPTSLSFLAIASLGLLRRRRRTHGTY